MSRDDALNCFYIQQMAKGLETIMELDQFCRKNRDAFRAELTVIFMKLADKIKVKQQNHDKEDIFCISICFLRSRFYTGDGRIRIYAFDKRFFLDTDPVCEDMDVDFLNHFIWDLENDLMDYLEDYKKDIVKSDVQKLIQMEYIPHLIGYITELARYTMRKGSAACFHEISVTEDFCITAGENQGDFDEIFVTEKVDTSGMEMGLFLKIHSTGNSELYCKRYTNETLENMELKGVDFTKSHFEKVSICNSKLEDCILIKTEWIKCKLTYNSWQGSQIFEADFTGSDLTGSDFSGIVAPIIPPNILYPYKLSFNGLDYTDTILDYVKFVGADVRGADFTGARFIHTDFSDALLDNALFDQSALNCVEFTDAQRKLIRIDE